MSNPSPRFAPLVDRIASEGSAGWDVHHKAFEARRRGEDVIFLSVGDPDFPTPKPIVDSAVAALRGGDTHYSEIAGRRELREAVAANARKELGLDLGPENIAITAGTQGAMAQASMCLFGAGDEVVALEPMYLTYEATLRLGGGVVVPVGQPASNGFRPDIDAIRAAVTDRTRGISITTPNNPTGVILRADELEAIASVAIDNDLWVISDEVYADLIFDGEHKSIAAVDGMADRTVIVSSVSKSHAMTGWRIGWAIGPADLIEHVWELQLNINYGVPGFIQQAALDALTTYREASADMCAAYRERRDLVASILGDVADLDVLVPEAGMYVMLNTSRVAGSGHEFANDLFDATGVAVVDAGAFGSTSTDWVRVAFTISNERLTEACTRIAQYVNAKK